MICILHKKYGLKMKRVWFACEAEKSDFRGCDFISYGALINEPNKELGLTYRKFGTLHNNLYEDSEQLMRNYKSNVRNEIRRAEREGVESAYITCENIDMKKIEALCTEIDYAYKEMCEAKNLRYSSIRKVLIDIRGSASLIITTATIDNENVVYHVYISDGYTARLTYSISLFRESKEIANAIGRANRMLHYRDMIALKESGHQLYDWGGYSLEKEEIKSISEFKAGFGGVPVNVYVADKPVSLLAKIALYVKKRG